MRNGQNMRNERSDGSHRSDTVESERRLAPHINHSGREFGAVAGFLKNVVEEQFARERAEVCDFRPDETERESEDTSGERRMMNHRPVEATAKKAADRPDTMVDAASAKIALWKRILDFAIISLTWPLWLPVMFVILIATKLSSPGPIFYRQERVGYRGKRFLIFKFRTMKVDVETSTHESHFVRLMETDSPMIKLDANGDPRLIRWGKFLRAAGLDELPQIFNIFRGEMSLVGPRPCTVHEFERYQPWQRERVNAPPGLTGHWQVNGKNNTTFSEMIAMDIFYTKNMSVWLDLSILFRTGPAVVRQVFETRAVSWLNRWKGFRGEARVTENATERSV